uniref:ZP domain-containing protein n=1 Tax=Plectus sambesii TaxID=2011161 RepID=A0A914W4F5_9BILA
MIAICDLLVGLASLLVVGLGDLLDTDQYTELIRARMRVHVDPLIVIAPNASNNAEFARNCSLVLKKDSCAGPVLSDESSVSWDTQICFQWTCLLPNYGMRVENCSTGSTTNPVYLLGEDGCTAETSMLTSPSYDTTFSHAYSMGWLTVRLVGASFIRFGCAIRLCHLCDCAEIAPPRNCTDYGVAHQNIELQDYNATVAYPQLCGPTEEPLVLIEEVANSTPEGIGKKGYLFITIGVVALLTFLFSGCAIMVDQRYTAVPTP